VGLGLGVGLQDGYGHNRSNKPNPNPYVALLAYNTVYADRQTNRRFNMVDLFTPLPD